MCAQLSVLYVCRCNDHVLCVMALTDVLELGPYPGTNNVAILDQAGWHGSFALVLSPSITRLPLPLRCPKLNPFETVWQFMCDDWLSNRILLFHGNILDHCSFAWYDLANQ